jgi:hypothetical protein
MNFKLLVVYIISYFITFVYYLLFIFNLKFVFIWLFLQPVTAVISNIYICKFSKSKKILFVILNLTNFITVLLYISFIGFYLSDGIDLSGVG